MRHPIPDLSVVDVDVAVSGHTVCEPSDSVPPPMLVVIILLNHLPGNWDYQLLLLLLQKDNNIHCDCDARARSQNILY